MRPQPDDWAHVREAWTSFMRFITEDLPPPLTDRDTLTRRDPEWADAAGDYLTLKKAADEAAQNLEAAKPRLASMASHPRVDGAEVSVTRFFKQGNVDYKRVPQLAGVDLESFRGRGRVEVRITIGK